MARGKYSDVTFFWLGETLLIPHLWPIITAMAKLRPDLSIDIWISTSAHEDLLKSFGIDQYGNIRLRRPFFFRHCPDATLGQNVDLPSKLPMLFSILPHLRHTKIVIVAEQTSLWLPKLLKNILPSLPPFFFAVHGAGLIGHGKWKRMLSADGALVPNQIMAEDLCKLGMPDKDIFRTGYAKSAFSGRRKSSDIFSENKPIILYNPHWQKYRSSWHDKGRSLLSALVKDGRWNIIFAPHQRIVDTDSDLHNFLANFGNQPNFHADLDSFAMVDGSYTSIANIYLGDTSSQMIEYCARPRPLILLNTSESIAQYHARSGYNRLGRVINNSTNIAEILKAEIETTPAYLATQKSFAEQMLGDTRSDAALKTAKIIAEQLNKI